MNNSQNNSSQLSDTIKEYLNRGFGSMNKNDFEVWIFHYLVGNDFKGKMDYEISINLGIPISKVKRLRYEANLKYSSHNKEDYEPGFHKLLENVKFSKDGSAVKFIVEDVALRKYLEFILKNKGHLSDGSFNSEIITMSLDAFEFLLKHFWSKDKYNQFLKQAEKAVGKKLSMQDFLRSLAMVVSTTTLNELVNRGISFTIDNLPTLIELIKNVI